MINNDFVGFKFILTDYIKVVQVDIIDEAAMMTAQSSNLAIIDLAINNTLPSYESRPPLPFVKKLYQSSADQDNNIIGW
ncbi:hypothetical protein CYY_010475 [Polysphondylium violaceum]|uniref:Uncharacterized protein n=1 Tax=Polysphondylium violaceum TaxID=133409 RepID=A0A8J4PJS8_9MYCE|nr:hypothetical protein CYY_010475 [Polysphondylium violaceum]